MEFADFRTAEYIRDAEKRGTWSDELELIIDELITLRTTSPVNYRPEEFHIYDLKALARQFHPRFIGKRPQEEIFSEDMPR